VSSKWRSDSDGLSIRRIIPPDLVPELVKFGIPANAQKLNTSHIGEIIDQPCLQVLAVGGMVCTVRIDPGCTADFQIQQWFPSAPPGIIKYG
jgi:hypothetical protein